MDFHFKLLAQRNYSANYSRFLNNWLNRFCDFLNAVLLCILRQQCAAQKHPLASRFVTIFAVNKAH